MSRTGTAALVSAALGFLLFVPPAEGTQTISLVPRLKGVVISRSERVLIVDQVLRAPQGQPRTRRVVLSPDTQVGGRRTAAAAIRVHDLIRADGRESADGSLEALLVEVVLTGEEISLARAAPAGPSNVFWQWVLKGSLAIPLP